MSQSTHKIPPFALRPDEKSDDATYHKLARALHWTMAIGFVLMWLTGVLVTNVEGMPWFVENDRQGFIRDLHKSIGLTLLLLLVVRLFLRGFLQAPALPAAIPKGERRLAHLGHAALYATVIAATVTGFAIADLQSYGNAYFGLALPQVVPPTETVLGWSSNPWSYALHAILAYGLLGLVVGHVLAVRRHAKAHGVQLLPRMLQPKSAANERALKVLTLGASLGTIVVLGLGARGLIVLGPVEEPRDYTTTTPFGRAAVSAP